MTSEYFRARSDDHFMENHFMEPANRMPVVSLRDISHRAFKHIIVYVYTDQFEVLFCQLRFIIDLKIQTLVPVTKVFANWFSASYVNRSISRFSSKVNNEHKYFVVHLSFTQKILYDLSLVVCSDIGS